MVVANDNPTNPAAGTVLHEQNLTITNAPPTGADVNEVDASAPVLIGPGVVWLLIQAPPPVLIAADWDGPDVEWWWDDELRNTSRPNIYIRGAVR
jgi:hypothetical protein